MSVCNGGKCHEGVWVFCALRANHNGDCCMLEDRPPEPLDRATAEELGGVTESTLTGLNSKQRTAR